MAKVSYLHSSRSATAARYKFLDRLVREYDTDLKRFLFGILRNQEDVNDVAQDAYLKLYRLSKPEQIKYPKALLFRAASNLAIDRLNKRGHPSNSTELELDAWIATLCSAVEDDVSRYVADHCERIAY